MAEDKKGFILYADLLKVVELMPDEIAGKLFKIILGYVNDKNPEINDLLLKISFEPIRLQLKRDLVKWDAKKGTKSDAGRLGGIKSGEVRRKKNEANEANALIALENEANEANALIALENEANEAVNVTVTVNDNVNRNNDVVKEATAADLKFEKIFEMFKRVTTWSDSVLKIEVGKFLNKYPDVDLQKSGGLINTWAANFEPAKSHFTGFDKDGKYCPPHGPGKVYN